MRSHVMVGLLLAAIAGASTAQGGMVPQFGVKGGLNLSDVNLDDLESSRRTGWVAGLYCDFATPLVHLQPEVLVSTKGFAGGEVTTSNVELDYRTTALQIPVLVVFSLPIPSFSPRAYLGPAVNIPLSTDIRIGEDDDWEDIDDSTQTWWSMIVGAGVTIGPLGFEVRYDIGITEMNEEPLGDIVESIGDDLEGKELEDRTWSVLASIGF